MECLLTMFLIDYVTNDLLTTTMYGRLTIGPRFFRAHIQSFLPPGHPKAQFLDTDRGYVGIQISTSVSPYTLKPQRFQYYGWKSDIFPYYHHEMSLLTYFMMSFQLMHLNIVTAVQETPTP
jgi:hypothetical protein